MQVLLSARAQEEDGLCEDVPEGDIFLLYDLSVRVRGFKPYRVRNLMPLHKMLDEEGFPEASSAMEVAVSQIVRPVKSHILGLLNDYKQGAQPRRMDRDASSAFLPKY